MHTAFSGLSSSVMEVPEARIVGQVSAVVGMSLTVSGLARAMGIGQRCLVQGQRGPVLGEVVGLDEAGVRVLPFGSWDGVSAGDLVEVQPHGDLFYPDISWIGSVVDALGRPLGDQGFRYKGDQPRHVKAAPPSAFLRKRVGGKLETQIKVVDVFTPICQGQRLGVFAGSGVGKSTMMAMLARNTQADVIVIGLVGERGREVQDFIQDDLGPEGMKRAVVVVATGDEPPLMRRQAAWTATAIAEYFRDLGLQVLLLVDSVTRFAMAQREIGLSGGEPPTSKGYPPTVFAELPKLLERAGPGAKDMGDITALYTVLVDGDDLSEPISDTVRGITDGHIVLDRKIAEQGRYPAVNVQKSISRMLPECHSELEYTVMLFARRMLAKYADMEELIRVGAYKKGSDPDTDAAIRFSEPMNSFLNQRKAETVTAMQSFTEIYGLLGNAGIEVPLPVSVDQQS